MDTDAVFCGIEAGGPKNSKLHAAPLTNGSKIGILHGAAQYVIQDKEGQIGSTESISAGLDYPGISPLHCFLKDAKRAKYTSANDEEALKAYQLVSKLENISPDLVIRIGQKPVSKILCEKLDQWNNFTVLVDSCGRFNDDSKLILSETIESAIEFIKSKVTPSDIVWQDEILKFDYQIKKNITEKYMDNWFEGAIAKVCFDNLNDGDSFFIGNSMPIRDVDMFVPASEKYISTFSNRGASGIDGIVSSALGVASKSVGNTLLLIGDLSFYHDMNGLLAAYRYSINLTIVVVNNSGGGIFSFLPISEEKGKAFDEFWSTTHNLDFSHVAKLYNCNYSKVDSIELLNNAFSKYKSSKGINIIEAITDITENVELHRTITQALAQFKPS